MLIHQKTNLSLINKFNPNLIFNKLNLSFKVYSIKSFKAHSIYQIIHFQWKSYQNKLAKF